MTLDATTASNPSATAMALPDFASDAYYGDLLGMIGSVVNFGLPGVQGDVERWLSWMLVGGSRPKPTQRTTYANSGNGYVTTQDAVCALLDRYCAAFDWDKLSTEHFKLIERATRPSPGTEPLV